MEGGPPCFPRNFTCFVVLRILPQISGFRIQGYYLLRLTFPDHSASHPFFLEVLYPDSEESVWAVPFSLAATGGIAFAFFSSGYLDVSVPRVPFLADDHPLRWPGFPIRISTDQYSLAVPRGFSQLTASFFGSWRLGIHRMPLVA